MRKSLFLLATTAILGLVPNRAGADQAGLFLVPADLDRAVQALPVKVEIDPVAPLRKRLEHLQSCVGSHPERPALVQALDIIELTRTIRLTTTERPLVAAR